MPRVVVGLSGGVDSALAAALLKERGFDVVGCYLRVAIPDAPCPWKEDLPMAHRVAAHLDIPLIVRDVSEEYTRDVLEPMIAAYRAGETPNPDVTCNRWVKFDALRAVAKEVGAERIATGHYARVCRRSYESTNTQIRPSYFSPSRLEGEREGEGKVELWRGVDSAKDQSYFLWMLTQEQLAMCEFPLGEWQKEDVRAEAKRRGLPNWDRRSTSGVCFLGNMNLAEFLQKRSRIPSHEPATVVTTSGEVIGTVSMAEALTIGQRAPIAGQPIPRYVVTNCPKPSFGHAPRVVVSASPDDPARFTRTIEATNPNWIGTPPMLPLTCTARIRHRQKPVSCTVLPSLSILFATPLTGVAPGQAVVLTDGDRVLGGAQIIATHG